MKRSLTVFTSVTVIVGLGLSGCAPSPISVGSPPDPTTTTTQSHYEQDLGATAARQTSTPPPTKQVESARPTKTPPVTSPTPEESKAREPAAGTPEARPCDARRAVEVAREDLTRRSGLAPGEIAVISVEAVDWPDTSLGCPQPDMAYAQIITPGYLIVLEAAGQTYEYHADDCRFVVLCRAQGTPSAPLIPVNPDEIDDGEPWVPVH
jgi:hypothetical protein